MPVDPGAPADLAAADMCKACEDECRKHEKKYEACQACGDACTARIKQCRAVSV